jgi:TonB family protein
MNIREQFGKYLLLKKLSEDAMGETFRAGRVGAHGMEQVVLLRVFNGAGIDGANLTQSLTARRDVQKALVSPNVGNGVDLGEVRGVPFVAYDYISGKDLSALQEQAKKRNHPIPSDHALLIAERIALALAVGYETRIGDDRVLHGCTLPQLVMISNEGETRLLGFEAAPGLRQVMRSSTSARPLARYLSPEARAGAPAHKSDDVYSVGAILLELLTGHPVPAEADFADLIETVEMQSEGAPLPEDLKRLLKQSLTTQDKRLSDVITWHKALSRMMFDGQYNPTTFNLAFFMHNLFRDEIEKESREIEVEKTMELPAAAVAAAAAAAGVARPAAPAPPAAAPPPAPAPPATATDLRETTGVRAESAVFKSAYGNADESKGSKMPMILGAIAAVAVIGVGVGWFLMRGDGEAAGAAAANATTAASAPIAGGAVPASADPAALQAQAAAQAAEAARLEELYREMLEKQSKELEERYRQQFDTQLETLRDDLDAAKKRAADAQAAAAAPAPAPAPRRQEPIATPPPRPVATQAAAPPPAAPPAATEAAPAAAAPVEQAAAPVPAAAAPAPAPAASTVQRGELVTNGPGVVLPRLQVKPRPTYPPAARSLRKQATVVVRVLVDENGRVSQAELKGAEVGFGLDHEALRAARGARYSPPTKDGVPVKIWLELPIEFRL